MRQQDLIQAVNTIHADRDLRDKVLSGCRAGARRTNHHLRITEPAVCAVMLLIAVCGVAFAGRALQSAKTESPAPASVAVEGTYTVNGLYRNDQVTNILILGVDRSNPGDKGRSDCVLLLSIDGRKESERLALTPFSRDLYVSIPGKGSNRLGTAYSMGGAPLTVKTMESNFKIHLDSYVVVDYSGFIKIVDRLGGLRLNLTADEAGLINRYSGESAAKKIRAGDAALTGRQALYYCRIRQVGGETERQRRDQAVMASIFSRCQTLDKKDFTTLAPELLPCVTSNMSSDEVLALISKADSYIRFPVSYFRLPDHLVREKAMPIQGGAGNVSVTVLVPDLKSYNDSLYRFIYQNKAD